MLTLRGITSWPPLLALTFSIGMLFGAFFQNMLSQGDAQYGSAAKVMNMSSLARVGLSHDADIFKRVMVEYFEMPHVTQIARATLLPGQVASENK